MMDDPHCLTKHSGADYWYIYRRLETRMIVTPDIILEIAKLVHAVKFNALGACLWRAHVGQMVLGDCGIESNIVAGSMLFRVGPHRLRDTVRYAMPGKIYYGNRHNGHFMGHVWLRSGDDLVDFSVCDWYRDS